MGMIGRVRNRLKTTVGAGVDLLMPKLASERHEHQVSPVHLYLRRLALHARLERARIRRDDPAVEAALRSFWQGETGDAFYDDFAARFEGWFNGPHRPLLDALETTAAGQPFRRVVEIGCGAGSALAFLADRLPGLQQAIGVDINPAIIARNRRTWAGDPRMQFVDGEASSLVVDLAVPGTLLFSYGGVMEYFTGDDRRGLFRATAALPGGAVALVEPVDPAHDLDADPGSHVFGGEDSFSHNHRALIESSGLRVVWSREIVTGPVRWMMLIARSTLS